MPTVIDELIVQLDLDPTKMTEKSKVAVADLRKFEEAAKKHATGAELSFQKLTGELQAIQQRLLGIAALFLGGVGLTKFSENVATMTNALGRLSDNFAVNRRELYAWGAAAAAVGADDAGARASVASLAGRISSQNVMANEPRLYSALTFMKALPNNKPGQPADVTGVLMKMSQWGQEEAIKAGKNGVPNYGNVNAIYRQAGISEDLITLLNKGPDKIRELLKKFDEYAPSGEQVKKINEMIEAWAGMQAAAEKAGVTLLANLEHGLIKILKDIEDIFSGKWKADPKDAAKISGSGDTGPGGVAGAIWNSPAAPPYVPPATTNPRGGYRPGLDAREPASRGGKAIPAPSGDQKLGEAGAHGYQGQGRLAGVQTDPWLVDTVREASKSLPSGYRAEVISTVDERGTGTVWHPNGKAIDVQIYDPQGRKVPNVGAPNVPGWELYERMALAAKQYQSEKYPNETFTWGGHFNSGTPYDRMHFQSGGVSARNFTPGQLGTRVLKPWGSASGIDFASDVKLGRLMPSPSVQTNVTSSTNVGKIHVHNPNVPPGSPLGSIEKSLQDTNDVSMVTTGPN